MKNLKDYFSSPKSAECSLEEPKTKNNSPDSQQLPSKRKNRKSLSSNGSKRKKLSNCTDSPIEISNKSGLNESDEFETIQTPKSKKKSSSKRTKKHSLSLKRKHNKNKNGTDYSDNCEVDNSVVESENKISIDTSTNDIRSKLSDSTGKISNCEDKLCNDLLSTSMKSKFVKISKTNEADKYNGFTNGSVEIGDNNSNKSVTSFFKDNVSKSTGINVNDQVNSVLDEKNIDSNDVKCLVGSSPKCLSESVVSGDDSVNIDEKSSLNGKIGRTKRKKRNRKNSESEAKSDEGDKTRKKRKSDDANETLDESADNRRSLLNYFNKVDKSAPAMTSDDKKLIKVTAIVHEPKSNEKSRKPLIRKKVKRRPKPDYDLITSEEDCSLVVQSPEAGSIDCDETRPCVTPSKNAWKMKICLPSRQSNGDSTVDETFFNDDSVVSSEGTADNCAAVESKEEVLSCQVESSKTTATSLPKVDEGCDVVELLDTDSSGEAEDKTTSALTSSVAPSLKGASTLTAYFGLKSDSKRSVDKINDGSGKKKADDRLLATQMFLQSPAPPAVKKIIDQNNRGSESTDGVAAKFPTRSHVRQEDRMNVLWNLRDCDLRLKPHTELHVHSPPFSTLCDLTDRVAATSCELGSSSKSEISCASKQLREKEVNLPIKKWLESLRTVKRSSPQGEMWCEKYRPKSTDEVVLGRADVNKLSDWLQSFQSNTTNGDSDSDSSGDEFINDKGEKVNRYGNTALLVGPPGVGKTACVYAAAKQNGYQVLELNASCNRNGKKVLHEFSEATQSHKVETKSLKSKLKKKSKNKQQSNKKSLLLIEDSDLIFNDVDDGYINSLSLLQSGSKRPLVLIANDPHCKHLTKLISSKSTVSICFKPPPTNIIGSYLKSISLVEGYAMSQEACDLILESTECDIRKAITNIQFYAPLYKQLDRRKLSEMDDTLSSFTCCQGTREEVIETCRRAKLLTSLDLISVKKIGRSRHSCLRQSTSLDLDNSERPADLLRSDLMHSIYSLVPDNYQTLTPVRSSILAVECLSNAVDASMKLNRRAFSCDYSSSLRVIARAEHHRLSTQTKRNKRYFNHLHNLGVDTSDQRSLQVLNSLFRDGPSDQQACNLSNFDDLLYS